MLPFSFIKIRLIQGTILSFLALIFIIHPYLTGLLLIRNHRYIGSLQFLLLLVVIFLNLCMNFLLYFLCKFNRVLQLDPQLILLVSLSLSFRRLIWRWPLALDYWFGIASDAATILLFLLAFLFILLVCLADRASPWGLRWLLWSIVELLF